MRSLPWILVLAACGSSAPAEPPRIEPARVAPAAVATPPGPWGVRWVRTCPAWSGGVLLATDHRVMACGILFDDAGAVVGAREPGFLVATAGDRSLWESTGTFDAIEARGEQGGDLVWRDEELRSLGRLAVEDRTLRIARDGNRVLAAGDERTYAVDLASGRATELAGCQGAHSLGWSRGGAVQCIAPCDDGDCLYTLPDARVPLPEALAETELLDESAAQDRSTGRWLALGAERARWLDDRGVVLETRDAAGAQLLDMTDAGLALVAQSEHVELWRFDGSHTAVERVLDANAGAGAIVGERIVLRMANDDLLWMERGARGLPHVAPPAAPPGFHSLEAAVALSDEGPRAVFRDEAGNEWTRGRAAIASFADDEGTFATVHYADAAELSRAGSDEAAWARLAAERFVVGGEQRWAKTWTDRGRLLRGHTYIGGCERTDIDVLVREREDSTLEVWTAYSGEPRALNVLFGEIPTDAREVMEARSDRYEGDPSIGQL